MSAEEIAAILEALRGLGERIGKVETQSEENGLALAGVTAELRGLKEQVNRMNPVWTAIFRAMGGYGNLVTANSVTKAVTLLFWSIVMGVLVIAMANKIGLDTNKALGEVNSIVDKSTEFGVEGPPAPDAVEGLIDDPQ